VTSDAQTSAFYAHWAAHGEEADRSAISHHFESAFAPGARVLDVGCGKGRDVVALLDMGFDAYGIEPNDAMRARAIERHPRLASRVAAASLPDIGQPFGGGFDAVVCCAVLMHLSESDLGAAFDAMIAVLRPEGRLLLALPEMLVELLVDGRDPDGRQFANHAPEHVVRLLAERGLSSLGRRDIVTASIDTRWRVMLFER
jgi:SAM-dependent methyltransferase